MNNLKIIQTIDYILKELDYKYNNDFKIYITEENEKYFDNLILNKLKDEYCLEIKSKSKDFYYEWEYRYTENYKWIYNLNTLLLFDYKRKLLWKYQKSIINISTLERIARFIWDTWNAQSIIEVLEECRVPKYLIIYPNTKWRMVYDILKVLSTSIYEEWHKLLFSIIESFLNPIRFNSIENWIETQKHFSSFLNYDWFEILKWKVTQLDDKKDMYDIYYENKEWKIINLDDYDKIKDIISNSDYKKITLLKWQDWNIDFIEWERHINREWNKFVDLENQFPFADITSKNHNWKSQKYIVNEKIKLKKDDK